MRPKISWIVCALCALVTTACEDSVAPVEECLAQVETDYPSNPTLFKGDSLQLSVVVRDCNNIVLSSPVRWMSSNPTIVTVDSTGLAIARAQGHASINWSVTDSTTGGASRSLGVQVWERAARVVIDPDSIIVVPDGPGFLRATAFAENGDFLFGGWTTTWESGDESIAVVDTFGTVRGVAEGVTTVTATVDEMSATVEVTVTRLTFVDVHADGSFSCGATTDALVFCWGGNFQGELGNPEHPGDHGPRLVTGPTRVRSVATGESHACSLNEDGAAMCWGWNLTGQLGGDLGLGSHRPSQVTSSMPFKELSAGSAHTCGITTGNVAFCWGSNAYGQLGAETPTACSFGKGSSIACSRIPIAVSSLGELRVISAGGTHTCGLDPQGTAICWGANAAGQLGLGTISDLVGSPTNVDTPLRFEGISGGGTHSCAVTSTGEIHCWGNNASGQLGNGSQQNWTLPVAVMSTEVFTTVSAGRSHTCALTDTGMAYCWGRNVNGQLGDGASGDQSPKLVPTLVAVVPALQSISAGATHSCGLGVDGLAYCWGDNLNGQLGAEAGDPSWLPIRVAGQR